MASGHSTTGEKLMPYIKLHIVIAALVLVSEIIGVMRFSVWIVTISLFPMLYAVVLGIIVSPNVLGRAVKPLKKLLSEKETALASPFIVASLAPLAAKYGVMTGPNVPKLIEYGVPLIVQNFGVQPGCILLALPIGLFLLRMGREVIGAVFDICREPALAVVNQLRGPDSPEALGTLGVYIAGTVYGTLWWAIVGSVLGSALTSVFSPYALAMACGPGSASMTTACATAMSLALPAHKDAILTFAIASNLVSGVIAVWYDTLVGLPLADKLYRVLTKYRRGSQK
ncbi:MAG: DUF3100 domain-containing protein [Zestosphaera sp.]